MATEIEMKIQPPVEEINVDNEEEGTSDNTFAGRNIHELNKNNYCQNIKKATDCSYLDTRTISYSNKPVTGEAYQEEHYDLNTSNNFIFKVYGNPDIWEDGQINYELHDTIDIIQEIEVTTDEGGLIINSNHENIEVFDDIIDNKEEVLVKQKRKLIEDREINTAFIARRRKSNDKSDPSMVEGSHAYNNLSYRERNEPNETISEFEDVIQSYTQESSENTTKLQIHQQEKETEDNEILQNRAAADDEHVPTKPSSCLISQETDEEKYAAIDQNVEKIPDDKFTTNTSQNNITKNKNRSSEKIEAIKRADFTDLSAVKVSSGSISLADQEENVQNEISETKFKVSNINITLTEKTINNDKVQIKLNETNESNTSIQKMCLTDFSKLSKIEQEILPELNNVEINPKRQPTYSNSSVVCSKPHIKNIIKEERNDVNEPIQATVESYIKPNGSKTSTKKNNETKTVPIKREIQVVDYNKPSEAHIDINLLQRQSSMPLDHTPTSTVQIDTLPNLNRPNSFQTLQTNCNISNGYLDVDSIANLKKAEHYQKARLIELSQESSRFLIKNEILSEFSTQSESSSVVPLQTINRKKQYQCYIMPITAEPKLFDYLSLRKPVPEKPDVEVSGFRFIQRIYNKRSFAGTAFVSNQDIPISDNHRQCVTDKHPLGRCNRELCSSDGEQLPIRVSPKRVPPQSLSSLSELSSNNVNIGCAESAFLKYPAPHANESTVQLNQIRFEFKNERTELNKENLNVHVIARRKFLEMFRYNKSNTPENSEKCTENVPIKRESFVFLGFEKNEIIDAVREQEESSSSENTTTNEEIECNFNRSTTENGDYSPNSKEMKRLKKIEKDNKKNQEIADLQFAKKIHRELNRSKWKRTLLPRTDSKEWF